MKFPVRRPEGTEGEVIAVHRYHWWPWIYF